MGAARHLHAREHAASGTFPAVDGSITASTGDSPTLYDVNSLTPSARASRMFKTALDAGGMSYAAAGDVLGVSAQRVASKCHPARADAPALVADALTMLDNGKPEPLASLIRSLQAELDAATIRTSGPRPLAVGMVAIQICARASEAAEAANDAVVDGGITDAARAHVFERIGALSKAITQLQRDIAGATRVTR